MGRERKEYINIDDEKQHRDSTEKTTTLDIHAHHPSRVRACTYCSVLRLIVQVRSFKVFYNERGGRKEGRKGECVGSEQEKSE